MESQLLSCATRMRSDSPYALPLLEKHKDRWNHISKIAGPHRQDDSLLIMNRAISPQVFKDGVPPQVASRIETLHLTLNEEDDNLPEWLDVLSTSCFELQHLQFLNNMTNKEECPRAVRMRRLYILYRLPNLISIDGEQVASFERQLARPNTPNGHRVDRKEWMPETKIAYQNEDNESNYSSDCADVEVSLEGLVKPVNADPPEESFDEPYWELPFNPQNIDPTNERNGEAKPALIISEDFISSTEKRNKELFSSSPLDRLCTRNEKYLPAEEENNTLLIEKPMLRSSILQTKSSKELRRISPERTVDSSPSQQLPFSDSSNERNQYLDKTTNASIQLCDTSPSEWSRLSPHKEMELLFGDANESMKPEQLFSSIPELEQTPISFSQPTPSSPLSRPNKISKSRSLSSPFPIQFRKIQRSLGSNNNNCQTYQENENIKTTIPKVTTTIISDRDNFSVEPLHLEAQSTAISFQIISPWSPPPMDTTYSPEISVSPLKTTIGSPTACVITPDAEAMQENLDKHERRRKRLLGRWRDRSQIRSTPMLDRDNDSDEEHNGT